jgi:hypothetical protein
VSADRRVQAATEYLAAVSARSVATLPPSVLVRECAELRRLLRLVLQAADDLEVTALDQDITQVLLWGGAYLAPADAQTALRALDDAARCAEDEHFPSSPAGETAAAYRELHDRIERTTT